MILYSKKDIHIALKIPIKTVSNRIKKLNIKPYRVDEIQGKWKKFLFEESQFVILKNSFKKKYGKHKNKSKANVIVERVKKEEQFDPEIIYIHTTWEIRESKLNFM